MPIFGSPSKYKTQSTILNWGSLYCQTLIPILPDLIDRTCFNLVFSFGIIIGTYDQFTSFQIECIIDIFLKNSSIQFYLTRFRIHMYVQYMWLMDAIQ